MTVTAAQAAIVERLQAMPGRPPIAYPNGGDMPEVPRIVVQFSATSQNTSTLDGETVGIAEVVARVDVAEGEFDGDCSTVIGSITAQFPPGLSTSEFTVLDAPSPRPAIRSGAVYSVPVIIRARYSF